MPIATHLTIHALRRVGDRVLGLADLPEDDAEAVAEMRRRGVDVEAVTSFVRAIVARGAFARAPTVKFGGFRFILEGCTVVTVVGAKRPKRRHPRVVRGDVLPYGAAHWALLGGDSDG